MRTLATTLLSPSNHLCQPTTGRSELRESQLVRRRSCTRFTPALQSGSENAGPSVARKAFSLDTTKELDVAIRNEALAEAIRNCRWTAEEAAAELGVNRSTLRRWINGKTPNPKNAEYAAKRLNKPLETLWPSLVRERRSPPRLPLSRDFNDTLRLAMRLAQREVLIRYGWEEKCQLPVDLLLDEVATCLGRDIYVTVAVANHDKVQERTLPDLRLRKRLLDGLSTIANDRQHLLASEGGDLSAFEDGLRVWIDKNELCLMSSVPKQLVFLPVP